ncbi:MAG: hypothetical protein WBF30_18600, partial [Candidatus Acidiferrales bacterium]
MKDACTISPFSKNVARISKIASIGVALGICALISAIPSPAQTKQASAPAKQPAAKQAASSVAASRAPNLRTTPMLYLVGYAHLD